MAGTPLTLPPLIFDLQPRLRTHDDATSRVTGYKVVVHSDLRKAE